MKKVLLLIGILFFGLIVLPSVIFNTSFSHRGTVAMYEHPPSIQLFSTKTPEASNFNGPANEDIFSAISMSNELDGEFKIAVNFYTKTPTQTLVIENASLISSEVSLVQTYNEAVLFKEQDGDFFIASKWLFKALPQKNFPPSVDTIGVTVNYKLNDVIHSVDFILDRHEIGIPIH